MLRLLPALLLLASCGPALVPDYRTACGVLVFGDSDADQLELAEESALHSLEAFARFDRNQSCQNLRGWSLFVNPKGVTGDGTFEIKWRGQTSRVYGATDLDGQSISIGSIHLASSAYVHELAHALQWEDRGFIVAEDHGAWTGQRIWDAIRVADDAISAGATAPEAFPEKYGHQ